MHLSLLPVCENDVTSCLMPLLSFFSAMVDGSLKLWPQWTLSSLRSFCSLLGHSSEQRSEHSYLTELPQAVIYDRRDKWLIWAKDFCRRYLNFALHCPTITLRNEGNHFTSVCTGFVFEETRIWVDDNSFWPNVCKCLDQRCYVIK